jgi:hypothetical protein
MFLGKLCIVHSAHYWKLIHVNKPTKCTKLFLRYLYYNNTLNIDTCYDPLGSIIRESNHLCFMSSKNAAAGYGSDFIVRQNTSGVDYCFVLGLSMSKENRSNFRLCLDINYVLMVCHVQSFLHVRGILKTIDDYLKIVSLFLQEV